MGSHLNGKAGFTYMLSVGVHVCNCVPSCHFSSITNSLVRYKKYNVEEKIDNDNATKINNDLVHVVSDIEV